MSTKPNPKRPWKAIAGALLAALTVLVAQGQDVLPTWALLIIAAIIAGLGVFATPAD